MDQQELNEGQPGLGHADAQAQHRPTVVSCELGFAIASQRAQHITGARSNQ
ncbi:MAG TPA: hypothetical protein V6D07_13880 [Trichocoleus sp.]